MWATYFVDQPNPELRATLSAIAYFKASRPLYGLQTAGTTEQALITAALQALLPYLPVVVEEEE